jgi:HEAT repeat protein
MTEYTFLVTNVWKGGPEDTIRVRSSSSGSCSYGFQHDIHYLVYARIRGDVLVTGFCYGNSPVKYAVWDRLELPPATNLRPSDPVAPISLSEVFAFLRTDDLSARRAAVAALGGCEEIREEALPKLRRIVRGSAAGAAADAAEAISRMREGGSSAQSDLAWLLRHGTGEERASALSALIQVADRSVSDRYILAALEDSTAQCLTRACECAPRLALSDSSSLRIPAVERVIRLMDHPDFNVRAHAIFALEGFPSRALPLIPRLERINQDDPHDYVRYAARITTYMLTKRSLPIR